MTGKGFKLFKLFGFTVRVDWSWLIVAVLFTWSLAVGFFPFRFEGLSTGTYWVMGVIGALGLFLSVIIHEFSHSLVARQRGMNMKGITLFIFGGVAEMEDEPDSAKTEFLMAVVGPITSLVLGGLFFVLLVGARLGGAPLPVNGVLEYLAGINVLLAVFNMVPAYPLDGGRVLRSALWAWKDNIRWATRIAAGVGNAFGILLIVLGVLSVINGNFIGGIWWFLIGQFLRNAAMMSYQQVVLRQALEGETLRRFMRTDPVTVPPGITLAELVDNYIYRYHHKMFPVAEDGRLVGCVSTAEVKEIPRDQWNVRTVGSTLSKCSPQNTVAPDTDPMKALSRMNRNDLSRLLVVEDDQLVGVVTMRDIRRFLAVKLDLEDDEEAIPADLTRESPENQRDEARSRTDDHHYGDTRPRPV